MTASETDTPCVGQRRTARSVHPRVQALAFLQACETEFDEWRCRRRWERGYAKDGSEAIVQCGGGTIVRKRVSNPLHKTGFRRGYSIKHL